MKSVVALALAVSASASILARDVAAVLADLDTIQSNVNTLTGTINNFQTIDQAGPLLAAESALEASISKGTTDAQGTTGVTDDQAVQVLNKVKALIPDVVGAVNAATAKNSAFATADTLPIVITKFKTLQSLTDTFADALISKAPSAFTSAGNAAKSCIDSIFSAGLATPPTQASDCSGSINVPSGGGGGGSASSSSSSVPSSSSTSAGSTTATSTVTSTSTGGAGPTTTTATTTATSSRPTSTSAPYTGAAPSLGLQGLGSAMLLGGLALAF